MSTQTRRTFLKRTTAGIGAAFALTGSSTSCAVSSTDRPTEMKYSICNETFGDWPQDKIFKFAAECGYGGVEIAPFTINTDVTKITAEQRATLRKQAEQAGVEIVGLHWLLAKTEGLHLTSPDPQVRKKTAVYLGELAKFCADLGGKVTVFGSPKQRDLMPGVSREDGMKYAAEVFRSAMPTFQKHNVILALEPLGTETTNFIITAADGVELAKMVDSPNCKLLLDCKAMVTDTEPMPELIRKYGSWLVHFHANDPNLQGPGMGKLDFVPIFQALSDIDYRGWVSVEVFDYTPGPERLARESIEYMRKVEKKVKPTSI